MEESAITLELTRKIEGLALSAERRGAGSYIGACKTGRFARSIQGWIHSGPKEVPALRRSDWQNALRRRLVWLCALSFILLSLNVATAKNAEEFFKPRDQLALANAAAAGRATDMEALVKRGAKVNFQGIYGMTALRWALGRESKEGVSWLLDHGADPNLVYAPDGNSCVSIAAMYEDPWYLKQILAHGGNPNYRNPLNKHTPLEDAIVPVHPDNAKALLAAGADPNTSDYGNVPAIFNAAGSSRYEMVYDMLEAGANPVFAIGSRHKNSLVWVLQQSRAEPGTPLYEWLTKVKDLLKQKGVDVDTVQ